MEDIGRQVTDNITDNIQEKHFYMRFKKYCVNIVFSKIIIIITFFLIFLMFKLCNT